MVSFPQISLQEPTNTVDFVVYFGLFYFLFYYRLIVFFSPLPFLISHFGKGNASTQSITFMTSSAACHCRTLTKLPHPGSCSNAHPQVPLGLQCFSDNSALFMITIIPFPSSCLSLLMLLAFHRSCLHSPQQPATRPSTILYPTTCFHTRLILSTLQSHMGLMR